ncbi:MAG: Holliday junction resolvase RuvX [Acholeplasmataceae bacterium]
MKYLGIDLGLKTLGLAISESGIIAQSLTTIRFNNSDFLDALNQLLDIIDKYKIDIVVLGLPKHMNNDLGDIANHVLDFKDKLLLKRQIKVITWDERLSTRSALKSLSDQKKKYKKQKALKDEMAAQIILQNYLDSLN